MNGFFVRRVFGKIAPLIEIKSAKRAVIVIDDDVCLALKEQGERAPGGADIHGLPEPVQHEHMLIERNVHIECGG